MPTPVSDIIMSVLDPRNIARGAKQVGGQVADLQREELARRSLFEGESAGQTALRDITGAIGSQLTGVAALPLRALPGDATESTNPLQQKLAGLVRLDDQTFEGMTPLAQLLSVMLPAFPASKARSSKLAKTLDKLKAEVGPERALAATLPEMAPAIRVMDPELAKAIGKKPGETLIARDLPAGNIMGNRRQSHPDLFDDQVLHALPPDEQTRMLGGEETLSRRSELYVRLANDGAIQSGFEFSGEFVPRDGIFYVPGVPAESYALEATARRADNIANTGLRLRERGRMERMREQSRLGRQRIAAMEKPEGVHVEMPFMSQEIPAENIPYLIVQDPTWTPPKRLIFGKTHGDALLDAQLADADNVEILESGTLIGNKLVAQ